MAWLERKPNGKYLIQFRFDGSKYARSLKTKSESQALARKTRLEETIRLVDTGRIEIPTDCADLAAFLLSDGKLGSSRRKTNRVTLNQAFDSYLESLPAGALEPSTIQITKFRMNVLRRLIGKRTPLVSITKSKLQDFVNRRAEETGKHGRPINPSTIKSDLRVLSVVWTYALDEGIVDSPFPGRRLRLPKPDAKLPFQTISQIRRLLASRPHSDGESKQVWQRVFSCLLHVIK